jgi:hypothetical protein
VPETIHLIEYSDYLFPTVIVNAKRLVGLADFADYRKAAEEAH